MEKDDALIQEICDLKQFHRLFALDLPSTTLQEILKRQLFPASSSFFKTRRARDLFTQITSKIKSFAHTSYTRVLIQSLLPTTDLAQIKEHQRLCDDAVALTLSVDTFRELFLSAITLRYTSERKHNGICIAFDDEELYLSLRSTLSKKFFVTLIETEQDILAIQQYEQIRLVKTSSLALLQGVLDLSQIVVLSTTDPLEIAPEFITDILEEHQTALQDLIRLFEELSLSLPFSTTTLSFQRTSFHSIDALMQELFESFRSDLHEAISRAQFSGEQLMNLVRSQQSILDYLDASIVSSLQEKKRMLTKSLEELTGLSCVELFSISPLGELDIDDKAMRQLEQSYQAEQESNVYAKKVKVAQLWKEHIKQLPFYVEQLYQYDLLYALKQFIETYDLSKPELSQEGISFVYGKNMNLEGATPIEYHVGLPDKVAVVTGANSGGKTTLLELLGQIQILTQMGLYVPAREAKVGPIDEFYYFSKSKGSLTAGAFETLLKQFSDISLDSSRKLVLADEIESVTEPDVAAKIIKGIIAHLRANPQILLVLVTHMGRELDQLGVDARFDGIEAKGLNKDLELVVERNPLIGKIARSTPQLIIERLAKLYESPFYKELNKLVISS
ncbi:MAG: hypothetical protein KC535_03060 [Nanoarchaeota archaeon]|nr:hypothetical protein [Nanoarchaeota archaeon]